MTLTGLAALLGWAFVAVLLLFWRSFLPGYLNKKGENLATHEDIDKVLDQVRAVTTTTKEIEAKISNEVWDRQKRWELKRDAIFEGAKRVSSAYDAFSRLHSVYNTDLKSGRKDEPHRIEERVGVAREWNEAANRLEEAALLVGLACGVKLQNLLLGLSTNMRRAVHEMNNWQEAAAQASFPNLAQQMVELYAAMRKELGTDGGA
jgi:hypothetical protein